MQQKCRHTSPWTRSWEKAGAATPLGAFFKQNLGPGFHFNAATRDFIHHQTGKTLADAAICYQTSVRPGAKKSRIPQQLEYNQHFRDFFRDSPGSSRHEAIEAWWIKRVAQVSYTT